jgi:hypothetical protein
LSPGSGQFGHKRKLLHCEVAVLAHDFGRKKATIDLSSPKLLESMISSNQLEGSFVVHATQGAALRLRLLAIQRV